MMSESGFRLGAARPAWRMAAAVAAGLGVGSLTGAEEVAAVVDEDRADAVCVGRAALANPNWPTAAALALDVPSEQVPMARQYFRAKW